MVSSKYPPQENMNPIGSAANHERWIQISSNPTPHASATLSAFTSSQMASPNATTSSWSMFRFNMSGDLSPPQKLISVAALHGNAGYTYKLGRLFPTQRIEGMQFYTKCKGQLSILLFNMFDRIFFIIYIYVCKL